MAKIKKDKKNLIESSVGLDIGTYAVKVLQVKKEANQILFETYGELEIAAYDSLPPGSITNIGEEKMITAIRDLFTAAKITATKVAFSIPMQDCFIFSMTIPKVSDKELVSLLPIEVRNYLPIPVSEVKLNYWRTDIRYRTEDKEDTIIVAAVKNTTFELYERYAKKLGLENYSFEIESLSQSRIAIEMLENKNETLFCVDIGGKITFASLFHEGVIKAVNTLQRGSSDNTMQISKVLGLSVDVAEGAKRIFGYLGDDSSPHLGEVMGLASFPLFEELKHLLLNHERKYNVNIEKVIISGGGSLQKGIKEILSEFLNKEVEIIDSFANITVPNNFKDILREGGGKYAVAAGLAIKDYI